MRSLPAGAGRKWSPGRCWFFAFLPSTGAGTLDVVYAFGLRGSGSLNLVPRGGRTRGDVRSTWPSPSFAGAFLPGRSQVSARGSSASCTIDKLALGQPPVANAATRVQIER